MNQQFCLNLGQEQNIDSETPHDFICMRSCIGKDLFILIASNFGNGEEAYFVRARGSICQPQGGNRDPAIAALSGWL